MNKNLKKPKIIKRLIGTVLSAVLVVTGVPFPEMSGDIQWQHIRFMPEQTVKAADTMPSDITATSFEPNANGVYTLTSESDVKRFSWWYNTYGPATHIKVNIAGTSLSNYNNVSYFDLSDTFTSLGTAGKPFYGTIEITSYSVNCFYIEKPFFNVVDQRTKIVDENDAVRTIQFLCARGYTGTTPTIPVEYALANSVVNPSGASAPMECKAELSYVSKEEGKNVTTRHISGLIKTLGEGASASVELTNNSKDSTNSNHVDFSGSDAVGVFCGTMEKNATLTASVAGGTNTNYSVTCTGGKAGGMVGEMKTGAKLLIGSNTGFQSVTQTINGSYTGGLVGYAENAYIGSSAPASMYPISMTVPSSVKSGSTTLHGASGNGYLFGYYKVSDVETTAAVMDGDTVVTPAVYSKSCTLSLGGLSGLTVTSRATNAGGLIGVLELASTAETSAADSPVFTINGGAGVTASSGGTQNLTLNFSGAVSGGLIGTYLTGDLKNTLEITDVYTNLTNGTAGATVGGLIGKIDDSASAAYVKIHEAHTVGNKGGGLIGTAGSTDAKGAFVDVTGYNKVDGGSTGGLVSVMKYGVLRLGGTTDLTSLSSGNMILNTRDTTLVYANGSGNSGDANWVLKRSTSTDIKKDDIGSWGEVLRLTSANSLAGLVSETNFASAHTVSIAAAPVSTENAPITTLTDFARLALNIQHNTTSSGAALVMDSASASKSSTLLSKNIWLAKASSSNVIDFDLSNTGITGLTRDGSEMAFKSTLNGGGTTIKLAVGESYGVCTKTEGNGRIYAHRWSGLFAALEGATVKDLTVTGTCDKCPTGSGELNRFGGVAAVHKGTAPTAVTNVTSTVACTVRSGGDAIGVTGGMIGSVDEGASGSLSFNGCTSTAAITDNTTGNNNYAGGYIAYLGRKGDTPSQITVNFGNTSACTASGSYTNATAKVRPIYGGLIGAVCGTDAHTIAATVNVNDVAVSGLTVNAALGTDGVAGGLLGFAWYDANVAVTKLAVSNSSVTATGGSGNLGGLVYAATGHWTVCASKDVNAQTGTDANAGKTVTFTGTTFSGSGSLGLLTTRSFNEVLLGSDTDGTTNDKKGALYLELLDQTKYDPSGVTVSGSPSVFDELVAYSKHPDMDILENGGHSIVSINTDGAGTAVIMNGSACNTYQNKTTYGKNDLKTNGNTRYYYNLDTIRAKSSKTNAEKLLLWSVNRYAYNSNTLRANFPQADYAITSASSYSLDMTGLSYYTIDYDSSFPFSGKTFTLKFYNAEIENGESGTGNTDSNARSTIATGSQHYMMHCGLFRNAAASTISLGTVTLQGNVGKYYTSSGSDGSGFIFCGTLGGATSNTKLTVNGITLDGAYINGGTSGYAPLFVNKVRKNTALDIKNVRSSGYLTLTENAADAYWYAGSSLIGEVGTADTSALDSNMNLDFSSIALDARKTADDFSGQNHNTVYGSHHTIFSHATLLEHYIYSGTDSKGIYNYTQAEDWTNDQHLVTYGAEIDNTVDHVENGVSQQLKYSGSSVYTHPTSSSAPSAYGSFASKFRPYVYNIGSVNGDHIHELRINIPVVNLTEGCGTYNDPYVITDAKQLNEVASLMSTVNFNNISFQINLPSDGIADNLGWCDPATGTTVDHKVFQLNAAATYFVNGSTSYTREAVRKYLAGAYYRIETSSLVLPADFSGLGVGTSESDTYNYAFHGVIVGENYGTAEEPSYPTVTLTNGASFVKNSNGCVIKNLNFVKEQISMGVGTKEEYKYYGGCLAYGGVIDKIMGGDNIIDNVDIQFASTPVTGGNGNYMHLVPVGGYVGVILNGGLFFRNMDDVAHKSGITAFLTDANKKYLYRNPIIGRVLNGYAVCEDCDVLVNGDKNYYISSLDSTIADKLTVTSNSITAKNAQSWFVLSLLVNSGTLSDKTLYINGECKTSHLGSYDDVGCLNTKTTANVCDTALFASGYKETGTTSSPAVPHLLAAYTKDATWLNTSNGYAITMSGGTWTLDKGYRGIGGFNGFDTGSAIDGSETKNCNSTCVIQVSGITGNSTTINLDMKHLGYRHEVKTTAGSYTVTQDNYSTTENGFGLFNLFSPSQNGVTVENIVLSGTVSSDYVDKDTGEVFHDYPDSQSNWNAYYALTITNSRRLSTGMFAGTKPDSSKNSKVTLSNVSLNNASVHSGKHSGGFIGNASNVTLSACPATNVSSFGRSSVGGLIGYASDNSQVSGAAGGTDVTINAVTEQGKGYSNNKDKTGRHSGAGGLVGMSSAITIENINLSSVAGGLVQYDNLGSDDSSYVGCILGVSTGAITIRNCNVHQISALGTANRVGGVAGGTLGTQTLTATNVILDGGGTATLACTGKESVGGVIGYSQSTVSLTDVIIKNYIIQKKDINEGNANAMGCVVGSLYSDLDMKNVFISDCTLEQIDNATAKTPLAAGGIIGRANNGKQTIRGYNIVVRNISVNDTLKNNGKYKGNFIGTGVTSSYKVVGLSLQGNLPTDKMMNNTITNPTTEGSSTKYIIFSDYKGTNLPTASADGSGSKPKLNNTTVTMVDAKSPYATVNPRIAIDERTSSGNTVSNNELTGDGMGESVAASPIKKILDDRAASPKPNNAYTVSTSATLSTLNLGTFTGDYAQAGLTNDFVVMDVETLDHDGSHKMVNSYLQLLTNTNYNFGNDLSGVYKVEIHKMELQNGAFEKTATFDHSKTPNDSALNLCIDNGKFYMKGGDDVDTNEPNPTFSLIDVTFYDPTKTNSVAYHLYVPVVAKKMLKYNFELAVLSGTSYDSGDYADAGSIIAESLGSTGTLYFRYTYQRSKSEWQTALDAGENLYSNYDKILLMGLLDNATAFPDATKLVLVDANRGGKEYYSTIGDALDDATGKLSLYKTPAVDATTGDPIPPLYTFYPTPGTHTAADVGFEPIRISDLLYITAESNSSGNYVLAESEETATVEAYLNGTRTLFRVKTSSDTGAITYKLTIVNSEANGNTPLTSDDAPIHVTERYYLSFFTDAVVSQQGAGELIHYYTVTSDTLKNGPAPAKPINNQPVRQILFANLFEQSPVTYYTAKVNPESSLNPAEINDITNSVKVILETQIRYAGVISNAIGGQLSAVNMFQSFLVYLTKHDGTKTERAIQGKPAATANITISSSNSNVQARSFTADSSNKYTTVGLDYVEVASNEPIGPYIANNATMTVRAETVITYTPGQQAIQFPAHTGDQTSDAGKYAEVEAFSNIGFDAAKTALSKNRETAAHKTGEANYQYYIVSQLDPALDLYAYASDGSAYGKLGINANDLSDNTGRVHITAAADFDVRPIATQVRDADYIKLTLNLQKKKQTSDFNYKTYEAAAPINDYLYNVRVDLDGVTSSTDGTTYTFLIPRANAVALDNAADGSSNYMHIPLSFDVYTGTDAPIDDNGAPIPDGNGDPLASFEARGLRYANYKVSVSAQMLIGQTETGVGASAPGDLVYTNAKLIGDYIK
ncbi:MAG: hypothetical protein K5695_05835 [Oscillospiraceae bacterium]|nr:hypothetical protein [Oscillospiraceae bacterium]